MEPPPGMPPSYSGARERGVLTSSTGQVDTSALRGRASEECGSVNVPSQRQRRFLPSFATLPSEGWEKPPSTRQTAVDGSAQSAYSPARALRPTSCRTPFSIWRALQRG